MAGQKVNMLVIDVSSYATPREGLDAAIAGNQKREFDGNLPLCVLTEESMQAMRGHVHDNFAGRRITLDDGRQFWVPERYLDVSER